MKRSGHTQQQRPRRADRSAVAAAAAAARPPPPAEDSSDDEEPEQAPVQAKRPRRMVPEHASSSSDSEGGSGDSQSDTETSNGGEVRPWHASPNTRVLLPRLCPCPGCLRVTLAALPLAGRMQQEEDEDEGLPLGQLVALRQDGSTSADAMKARARALRHQGKASFKREGKHRPVEMSSKKPVPVFRDTLQGGKRCAPPQAGWHVMWLPSHVAGRLLGWLAARRWNGRQEGVQRAVRWSKLCGSPAPPAPPPARHSPATTHCRDVRDPRFESLSGGQYKEEQFKRRYAFLYDDKLPAERAELRAALGKAKGGAAREALQARMQHVEQQLRSEEARRKREGFKQQVKVRQAVGRAARVGLGWTPDGSRAAVAPGACRVAPACLPSLPLIHPPAPTRPSQAKERASVKDGKRPFYLKKSEQRRLELVAKYEELKAAGPGKLEQYLTKRRKRNAAKDHRHLPAGRRAQAGSGEQ